MPLSPSARFEFELKGSLDNFDWTVAAEVCTKIVEYIRSAPDVFPETSAKNILYALRRKQQFVLMAQVAEALLQSGLRTQQVRRQYAQALIDQGNFTPAEMMLHSIIQEPQGVRTEELEARGLTGRIYKQLYVNNQDPTSVANRANLERALNEYLFVYRLDTGKYLWHGINVVAITARARRDELPLPGLPDERALAREILAVLNQRETDQGRPLNAWDTATAMEAHLALNDTDEATVAAYRFADSEDVDAFEIASALRQLTEVWQLTDCETPGKTLLPILRAGHLTNSGSFEIHDPRTTAAEACNADCAKTELERIFGNTGFAKLSWYKMGLDRCSSVARIETLAGEGQGTGWLVNANDFFPGEPGILLLTNAHVVSPGATYSNLDAADCQVNFQAENRIFRVLDPVHWCSPVSELDATFLKLDGVPTAPPIALNRYPMRLTDPPPRMYIIGYPGGGDLTLSLQDNRLLGVSDTMLHYRTPTKPGSSGSPVFDPNGWTAVALHHSGSDNMRRLDGQQGTYQANEGISILAIQAATRAGSVNSS